MKQIDIYLRAGGVQTFHATAKRYIRHGWEGGFLYVNEYEVDGSFTADVTRFFPLSGISKIVVTPLMSHENNKGEDRPTGQRDS